MKITAIYGSPRQNGNTDRLLDAFLASVNTSIHAIEPFYLRDLSFVPCTECGGCNSTGKCVIDDDMNLLYPNFIDSDIVVLASPVFFYGLNALAKAMVDRAQCFWALKYLLKTRLSDKRNRPAKGVFLTVGGARGKKNFDGILLTLRYFFDALDMPFSHHLAFRGIDTQGAVTRHPRAIIEAQTLAQELAG